MDGAQRATVMRVGSGNVDIIIERDDVARRPVRAGVEDDAAGSGGGEGKGERGSTGREGACPDDIVTNQFLPRCDFLGV